MPVTVLSAVQMHEPRREALCRQPKEGSEGRGLEFYRVCTMLLGFKGTLSCRVMGAKFSLLS